MVLSIAIGCLVLAIALGTYRVLRGPSWGDRITAMDFLSSALAVLFVIIALKTGRPSFIDMALLISILGFLSSVALARYLLGGRVIE